MISVEQLIGELLLRHNCVVIPSFGGFVAKNVSATIDFSMGTIAPPRKSLLFNRQLVNNDGLLASEFARINELSYNEASSIIDAQVSSYHTSLRKGERITIDKVGFLYFDAENNICFEQDRFFNLLLESYGLGTVHFVPQQEEIPTSLDNTEDTEGNATIIELPITATQKSKVWRYVAAACLLPIAFYSFWIPVNTRVLESGMLSVKDLNPFYKQGGGSYVPNPIQNSSSFNYRKSPDEEQSFTGNENVIYLQIDKDLSIPVQKESNPNPGVSAIETNESYDLIVGCFSSVENAENFILSLKAKGVDAYLYDMNNGLRRISAGNRNSSEKLSVLREELAQIGVTGWVLKK
jgi:hypothetical protein